MGSLISPLLVAVAGILGTLLAPLVSVRLTAQMQRELADQQDAHARLAREDDERRALLKDKRTCYVTVNATARWYRIVQMNYLHALHEDRLQEQDRVELDAARRSYVEAVAEAQMVASGEVLDEMEVIFSGLSRTFRRIRRLEIGAADAGGTFDDVRADLLDLWEKWLGMRTAMRRDLGTHHG